MVDKTHSYEFKGKNELLTFELKKGVFYPTDTSTILIEACKQAIFSPKKILDLGCGCGLVGITLAKMGLTKGPVYASDLSGEAIELARRNAKKMSVDYIARRGNIFEPWKGEKFDVIIDDIAGISDEIAKISSWYGEGISCDAGRDGVKLILQMIEQSRGYLAEGGMLIFPVLSLSGVDKILQALNEFYPSYEVLARKDWFLPDAIAQRQDILMPLINDGSIKCQKKYGKWLWYTHIYKADK